MKTKINLLNDKDWRNVKKIILFGYGRQGIKMYETFNKDFEIVAVVDNDTKKQGRGVGLQKVLSFDQAKTILHEYKIVVTTSQYYYKDIKKQLMENGLTEYIDFVMYQQFITEWYFKYRNRINVLKTDITLTSRCTLNCKNCNQFLPYWKEKRNDISLNEIKQNLDLYFQCVDYLLDMDIIGGEPFLYTDLSELIIYLGENYRDRIGYIGFITNGMIVPSDEIFSLIKKYSFWVSISDYRNSIDYRNNIDELVKRLEQFQIPYLKNTDIDWFDIGFPEKIYHYEGDAVVQHMQNCNTIEHILDEQKLFCCALEWAAQKGGLYPSEEKAYVDLKAVIDGRVDRRNILELMMSNVEDGYLEFCKVCGGFGTDNNNKVETAKQYRAKCSS